MCSQNRRVLNLISGRRLSPHRNALALIAAVLEPSALMRKEPFQIQRTAFLLIAIKSILAT